MSPRNPSDRTASADDGDAEPSPTTPTDGDSTLSTGQLLFMLTLALLTVAYFLTLVV